MSMPGFQPPINGIGEVYVGSPTLDDNLYGTYGRDLLLAGAGNNTLIGGPGDDYLFGGGGTDKFLFTGHDTGGVNTYGNDLIMDFHRDQGDQLIFNGGMVASDLSILDTYWGEVVGSRFGGILVLGVHDLNVHDFQFV
jgi:Ca2+-binding RTX toxin-like protein